MQYLKSTLALSVLLVLLSRLNKFRGLYLEGHPVYNLGQVRHVDHTE